MYCDGKKNKEFRRLYQWYDKMTDIEIIECPQCKHIQALPLPCGKCDYVSGPIAKSFGFAGYFAPIIYARNNDQTFSVICPQHGLLKVEKPEDHSHS